MESVDEDLLALNAPGELLGKQDVGQLALPISLPVAVRSLVVDVVKPDPFGGTKHEEESE